MPFRKTRLLIIMLNSDGWCTEQLIRPIQQYESGKTGRTETTWELINRLEGYADEQHRYLSTHRLGYAERRNAEADQNRMNLEINRLRGTVRAPGIPRFRRGKK